METSIDQVLINSNGSLGCFDFNGSTEATRSTGSHHSVPIRTVLSYHTKTIWSAHMETIWSTQNSTSDLYLVAV